MKLFCRLIFLVFTIISIKCYSQEENRAYIKRTSKWPSTNIRVSWINPTTNDLQQRQWVQNAISNTWEKESAIKFIWCSNDQNTDGIRILIDDDWPHTNGLGKSLSNEDVGMVLNFSFYKWIPISGGTHSQAMNQYEYFIRVIAVHEFGHALGFSHEQNRGDCPNCDDKPQGEDGDWWTPTCDMHSVMNYCNVNYNNNGKLSDGDVEGIRALYGPPSDINPSSNSHTVKLVHNIKNNNDSSSTVSIYLTGDIEELKQVSKVTYKFGENFDPQVVENDNSEDNYSVSVDLTEATDFTLNATVQYLDGSTFDVQRYINFKPPLKRTSSNNFSIDFTHSSTGNGRYLFGFSIDPNSDLFNKIVRVEYTRDHPTFEIKTLTADNPDNNFKVEWDGWGCIPIKIKIYYKENDQLFYLNYTYDMCGVLGWH